MENTVSNPYTFNITSDCLFTGEFQSSTIISPAILTIENHTGSDDEYWGAMFFMEQFAWGAMTPYTFGEYVIHMCNVVVPDDNTSAPYFQLLFWQFLDNSVCYNLGSAILPNASVTINGTELHNEDAVSNDFLTYMQENVGEQIPITIKIS